MKFPSPLSLVMIAELIGAEILGNSSASAIGINEIHRVESGDICFVDHPKYYDKCLSSAAICIIINTREVAIPEGKTLLVVKEPFEAYLQIVRRYRPFKPSDKSISESAIVGEGSTIMPNVFIGHEVTLGKDCIIHPNVTILDYTTIGNNVVVQ